MSLVARAQEGWEAVIGLEIHVQLATRAKLFSAAPAPASEPVAAWSQAAVAGPNRHLDPVVLGLPGTLPTLNRQAVELALRVALALGMDVQRESRFARKHYFYPDLPKGYQITQGEAPLALGGGVWVPETTSPAGPADRSARSRRWVAFTRLHLEEDAGKSVHDAASGRTLVDFDRAGVALVELVTEPVIRSPEEAEAVFRAVREVAVAVGATRGDLERGHLRCDANVSVRRAGEAGLGPKVEVKNLNSFRFVRRALDFEVRRQIRASEAGEAVVAETRTWDDAARRTVSTRRKETSLDYRYLYEPDLMPLVVDGAWVERVRGALPELPAARRRRLEETWGLDPRAAATLGGDAAESAYFEEVARGLGGRPEDGREAAKWVLGELRALLGRQGGGPAESAPPAETLVSLLAARRRGEITAAGVKAGLQAAMDATAQGGPPLDVGAWLAERGSLVGADELGAAVAAVVAAHPDEVRAYVGGKRQLLGFFMGALMRALGGRADPGQAREALRRALDGVAATEVTVDGEAGVRAASPRGRGEGA